MLHLNWLTTGRKKGSAGRLCFTCVTVDVDEEGSNRCLEGDESLRRWVGERGSTSTPSLSPFATRTDSICGRQLHRHPQLKQPVSGECHRVDTLSRLHPRCFDVNATVLTHSLDYTLDNDQTSVSWGQSL